MGGGAPVVDRQGDVYVADGNGNASSQGDPFDFSDAVLKLDANDAVSSTGSPRRRGTRTTARTSTSAPASPSCCRTARCSRSGKTQTVYVLNPSHLGHVDGSVPTFTMCSGLGDAHGGDAIVGSIVVIACGGGLDAATYSASPPYGTEVWSQPATSGPPVFAAGLIWSISGGGGGSTLFGLTPSTGNVKVQYDFGPEENHFATPAIGDNMVVVASQTSLVAFPPA